MNTGSSQATSQSGSPPGAGTGYVSTGEYRQGVRSVGSTETIRKLATAGDVCGSGLPTRLALANAESDEYGFKSGHIAKRLPSRRWDGVGLRARISARCRIGQINGNDTEGGNIRGRFREPPARQRLRNTTVIFAISSGDGQRLKAAPLHGSRPDRPRKRGSAPRLRITKAERRGRNAVRQTFRLEPESCFGEKKSDDV